MTVIYWRTCFSAMSADCSDHFPAAEALACIVGVSCSDALECFLKSERLFQEVLSLQMPSPQAFGSHACACTMQHLLEAVITLFLML